MWCVAELNDEHIAKMEDVLETYERPYDPQEPVVCLDENPVTLHADVRPASPAEPGREARRDNEYERRGTANVFCAVEPKAGRHFTNIHRRKSLTDVFGVDVGNEIWDRFTVHFTPTHGSWLNQAEIEIGIFLAAMPWHQKNPRSQDAAPGKPGMESPHEPRPHQDQLEVRPQSRPS
jgi:hypothetical protein